MKSIEIINKLRAGQAVIDDELELLLACEDDDLVKLTTSAREVCDEVYGRDVYVRGLIEISSYCKNDCLYCGIRRSNSCAQRYRMTPDEIAATAAHGYKMGFRTFVLQGGEDAYFTDEVLCGVVREIKERCPGCAVTLSVGERSRDSYQKLRDAGADRYLLRHETANVRHYGRLHPKEMSFDGRMRCLEDVRGLGYQTGCGFMVGSPYQTVADIISDIRFIQRFKPHMVGIGPFIPHKDTPFAAENAGSADMTVRCLAIIRLMMPKVLLPSTTALGSIEKGGRARGILAGANVVMPNLSPPDVREKYSLYDGKLSTGAESAEGLRALESELEEIGYKLCFDRGDSRIK